MIYLDLSFLQDCKITQIYRTPEVPADPNANRPNPRIRATTTASATFSINNAKLYMPVVTLSITA